LIVCRCALTNDSLQACYEALRSLKNLESLTLRILSNKMDIKGFRFIKKLLSEMQQLQELGLALPFSLTEKECENLSEGLWHLNSLRVLRLKFMACYPNRIKDGIKKLPRLKDLYWDLGNHVGKKYEQELYYSIKTLERISWEEVN